MNYGGKLNGLGLFEGVGGITLGLEDYIKPVAYCEIEPFCQAVLLQRMAEGKLPRAPIWDDVRTLNGRNLPRIDIIYGGFPCQDISVAGSGKGLGGDRSGLFFEVVRLVEETNSPWVFLENVPALRTRGLKEVVAAFTEMGYDSRWSCISASSVGALHKRERWFFTAHSRSFTKRNEQGRRHGSGRESSTEFRNYGEKEPLAFTTGQRVQRLWSSGVEKPYPYEGEKVPLCHGKRLDSTYWKTEPDVGRVVNGVPFRVDRIKSLGNAVVPYQAKVAFEKLIGLNKGE